MAADMGGSYGSTLRYKSVQRMSSVGKHSLLGASGEISDFQEILRYLDELMSPISIVAAIIYIVTQLSDDKKPLKGQRGATKATTPKAFKARPQLGSLISMYGCYKYHNKVRGYGMGNLEGDAKQGSLRAYVPAENTNAAKNFGPNELGRDRQIAGFWGYVFQVIFQMNAGVVMLTDAVFWCIIVPFLALKDYDLKFLMINMHSMNAIFLLGKAALNCLRFPWFRIVYFFLWTTLYVIFQWILHSVISTGVAEGTIRNAYKVLESVHIAANKNTVPSQTKIAIFGEPSQKTGPCMKVWTDLLGLDSNYSLYEGMNRFIRVGLKLQPNSV